LLDDLSEYRPSSVLVVELADVPDLAARRPDPADEQHWAEQNTDWHTTEPTPDDVLSPPAPFDADELAEAGRRSDELPLLDPSEGWPASEVLAARQGSGHGFGMGWDDRAAESAALDRYERGCLPV
jgi:hypothetical protein